MTEVDRVKLLKAHAMRFDRAEVMAVLDLVGTAYFRRQLATTSEEAVMAMIGELAEALGRLPAEVRAPLARLIEDL